MCGYFRMSMHVASRHEMAMANIIYALNTYMEYVFSYSSGLAHLQCRFMYI